MIRHFTKRLSPVSNCLVRIFFLKRKLITNLAILNKWNFFSGMVDKWRDQLWKRYNFLVFWLLPLSKLYFSLNSIYTNTLSMIVHDDEGLVQKTYRIFKQDKFYSLISLSLSLSLSLSIYIYIYILFHLCPKWFFFPSISWIGMVRPLEFSYFFYKK